MESLVFGRDMVLFYGQDGEAVVRCVITNEALDDHFQGAGKNKLEVFRANRSPSSRRYGRQYNAGDTKWMGLFSIHSGDLPE